MTLPATQKVASASEISESPDIIQYTDSETPQITGPHDIIVKNKYAGVNFIEAYFRKGIYPTQFPLIFGKEASGVVAAVGDEVTQYKVGDKVAYMGQKAYAQYTKLSDSSIHIVKLADDATDEQMKLWAAALLQGLTTIALAQESYAVKRGDHVLVWAAAGGVGQILTKYVSHLGAHVIAVASSDEKLAIAKDLGAEFLIRTDEDVAAKVKEYTNNKGVEAVYDSIGKDTFDTSLRSLARKGTFVSYGNASGPVPPLSISILAAKNAKICRPTLYGYIATPEEWKSLTDTLTKSLDSGLFQIKYTTYPLSEYRQATTDLEARRTTGKLILEIPQ